jgi:4-hydroxythreonine-4-phosphate dehydrogenase
VTLAVSIGCPSGIGPEVAVAAAARTDERCLLVGDEAVIRQAARWRRVAQRRLVICEDPNTLEPGQIGVDRGALRLGGATLPGAPSPEAGAAQLSWIDRATDVVVSGVCDALVTGPVNKALIAAGKGRAAKRFAGHTEHLARRLGAAEVVMAFVSGPLSCSLVTTHLPLSRVPAAITPEAVAAACYHLGRVLGRLRTEPLSIGVASLNPHAGEDGLLGQEEKTRIAPGIVRARRRLAGAKARITLVGPLGAETAFRLAAAGKLDGVVAMYHDQATIPMKLVGFGEAVNVTLGLPIVRTSVDHGTAYDRAGQRGASARGMFEALRLAAQLSSAGSDVAESSAAKS